jgi:hypothetical protein
MNAWKAQARTAYAAGSITVRRQGESANRTVSAGRHLSGAVAGDWVLVVDVDGALWAVMLIGTGPTAYPANPAVDGSVPAAGTLIVPAGWSGYYQRESGFLLGNGWSVGQSRMVEYFWNGSELVETVTEDVLRDAAAYYPGLAGLTISAASIQMDAAYSRASTTARIALLSVPTSRPPSNGGIVRLDSIAAPALPTSGPVTVALPAAWCTQLMSGAANGIGMYDDTRATSGPVVPIIVAVPSLSVTYS